MTGMPPPTAASKFSAHAMLLGEPSPARTPCLASSALLAVTTDLPDFSAASIADSAGSPAPPISSTKQSMPGSLRQRQRARRPSRCRADRAARFLRLRARGDGDDAHAAAAARGQRPRLLLRSGGRLGADRAEPRDTHSQGCDHDMTRTCNTRTDIQRRVGERNHVVQRFNAAFKEAAHVARGLADALLVFHQAMRT